MAINTTNEGDEIEVSATVKFEPGEKRAVYEQTITALAKGDEYALMEIWLPYKYDADRMVVLNSMFNSQQRAAIKNMI